MKIETVGEAEDHGWQTEWEIRDGFVTHTGLEITGRFVALGASQSHAAITARIHFAHKINNKPIGQG